jgi:hypothetical protein
LDNRELAVLPEPPVDQSKTGRKRYKADISDVVPDFELQGLPGNHGIKMRTRQDGQAWYGWRVTIAGWVFGIGASGPPPCTSMGRSHLGIFRRPMAGLVSWSVTGAEWRSEPRTI